MISSRQCIRSTISKLRSRNAMTTRFCLVTRGYSNNVSPNDSIPPTTSSSSDNVDPKLSSIVDQISTLSLLEAADLVSLLKKRLNIADIAMPVAAAPVAGGQAAEGEEDSKEDKKPAEKTIFNLKLEKFDSTCKAKIIKEIKGMTGTNLVEAKKLAESVPKILKENLNKEDAEKFKAALEAVGGVVVLE